MLEVKWKECSYFIYKEDKPSFNPCYVGSKMESLYFHLYDKLQADVSILVMLEVKWKVKTI